MRRARQGGDEVQMAFFADAAQLDVEPGDALHEGVGCFRTGRGRRRDLELLAASGKAGFLGAAGGEAVMADAFESLWQDMQQEAS